MGLKKEQKNEFEINTPQELNDLISEMESADLNYDLDIGDFLLSNSIYNEYYGQETSIFDMLDLFNIALEKGQKIIYQAQYDSNDYFFVGDLKKEIIPLFKNKIKELKESNMKQLKQDLEVEKKSLESSLNNTKKRLEEVNKQLKELSNKNK